MTQIKKQFIVKSDEWKEFIVSSSDVTTWYSNNPNYRGILFTLIATDDTSEAFMKWSPSSNWYKIDDIEKKLILTAYEKTLVKTRHVVDCGVSFEIDEYQDSDLVVAIIKLNPNEFFHKPIWLGDETNRDFSDVTMLKNLIGS